MESLHIKAVIVRKGIVRDIADVAFLMTFLIVEVAVGIGFWGQNSNVFVYGVSTRIAWVLFNHK